MLNYKLISHMAVNCAGLIEQCCAAYILQCRAGIVVLMSSLENDVLHPLHNITNNTVITITILT